MATAWSKKWKRRYSAPDTPGAAAEQNNVERKETEVSAIGEGGVPSTTVSSSAAVTSTEPPITLSSTVQNNEPPITSSSTVQSSLQKETTIMSPENLERDYWDIVETHSHEVDVDYGYLRGWIWLSYLTKGTISEFAQLYKE
jgi:hypothetical protein